MPTRAQVKIPQYKRVATEIRDHIRVSGLNPGDRLPSYAQMQRDYGASITTIDRAQKALAAEGVLVCRQGSGTFVAEPAKNARMRKGIIGLCGTGITYPAETSVYWRQLAYGIRGAAEKAGDHLLMLDHRSVAGWEKVDGLLVSDHSGQFSIRKWTNHMPCVSLLTKIPDVCSVYCDDAAGIYQAIAHLVELGHHKIGYLHGAAGQVSGHRVKAYRGALKTAGIPAQRQWMREMQGVPQSRYWFNYGQAFVETGRENMRTWLQDGWVQSGCTALLVHNDEVAFGAIEALQEAGIRVPENISVVGFDGSEVDGGTQPTITTVEVPLEEIGRRATEILLKQIEADQVSDNDCILPVTLRLGGSTTSPA